MTKFYQRLLAAFCGIVSVLALFLMSRYATLLIFTAILLFWSVFLVLIYVRIRKFDKHKKDPRLNNLSLIFFTLFAFLSLFVLMELAIVKIFLAIGLAAVVFLLYSSSIYREEYISYKQKPYRRLLVILWVFNAYAFSSTLFALGLFFQSLPFWLLTLVGGVLFAYISVVIWKMYLVGAAKNFVLWTPVLFFVIIEVIWVIHLLTFGYLVSGLLVTWVWYVIQILVRFHLSKRGIIWKKQKWFLFFNFVLYLAVLFLVRWV